MRVLCECNETVHCRRCWNVSISWLWSTACFARE